MYIITKALCGLKFSSAAFRSLLAEIIDEMGFNLSIDYPDVWIRPTVKPYRKKYHDYVLVYVYDILMISIDATKLLLEIAERFQFKKNIIELP